MMLERDIDETILVLIDKVKDTINTRFSVNITEEDIKTILDTQIDGFKEGIIKGLPIHFPSIGRFVNTNRTKVKKEIALQDNKLEQLKDIYTSQELDEYRKDKAIKRQEDVKDIIKKSSLRFKNNDIDITSIKNTTHNKTIFKKL